MTAHNGERRTVEEVPTEQPTPANDSVADAEIASYLQRAAANISPDMPALSAFQRRMEHYPQLTPEAQNELVARYQTSLHLQEQQQAGTLPARHQRRAQTRIDEGQRALEHLAGANFRLILIICREQAEARYGGPKAATMLPDLVSEANAALIEACRSYDASRVPTFPKYAARAIRDRVRMVISQQGPLRLAPSWVRVKKIAAVRIPELEKQLGRPPSTPELQEDLLTYCKAWAASKLTASQRQLPADEQEQLQLAKLRKQGMLGAIDSIEDVLLATQPTTSLDQPVGDGDGAALGEMLPEEEDSTLFDSVELSELRDTLMEALATLTDREREILLLRFGFADGQNWTYATIAQRFDVTAERIRQIEKAVLSKLATPHSQYAHLASFLPSQLDQSA